MSYWDPIAVKITKRNIRSFVQSLAYIQVFCKLHLGYAPGGGTPDTTIPHWVMFWLCYVIGLNSTVGAK